MISSFLLFIGNLLVFDLLLHVLLNLLAGELAAAKLSHFNVLGIWLNIFLIFFLDSFRLLQYRICLPLGRLPDLLGLVLQQIHRPTFLFL
jgi:hypothetical protein